MSRKFNASFYVTLNGQTKEFTVLGLPYMPTLGVTHGIPVEIAGETRYGQCFSVELDGPKACLRNYPPGRTFDLTKGEWL